MKNGAAQCVASPNSGGAVRHPSQDRLPTDLHSAGQLALPQRTADQPAQALQTSRFILFPLPLAANEAGPPVGRLVLRQSRIATAAPAASHLEAAKESKFDSLACFDGRDSRWPAKFHEQKNRPGGGAGC